MKRIAISKRMRAKLERTKTSSGGAASAHTGTGRWLASVVRGRMAYYAVPGNAEAVRASGSQVTRYWLKALRRRSQKTRMHSTRKHRIGTRWLPPVRVMRPFREARFAATAR